MGNASSLFLAMCAALFGARAETMDLGAPVPSTPYDPHFQPVFGILRAETTRAMSLRKAQQFLQRGRAIEHVYDARRPHVPNAPEVTERLGIGDCKDKALWLARAMRDQEIRYVVGVHAGRAQKLHAWLMWKRGSMWWILDPTFEDAPIPCTAAVLRHWRACYSYDRAGAYQHAAAAACFQKRFPAKQIAQSSRLSSSRPRPLQARVSAADSALVVSTGTASKAEPSASHSARRGGSPRE